MEAVNFFRQLRDALIRGDARARIAWAPTSRAERTVYWFIRGRRPYIAPAHTGCRCTAARP